MNKKLNLRKSIAIEDLEEYVRGWEQKAKGFAKVYPIGESGGWPILCAEFTDPTVPAEEKEVALITAQHSGMEISGMTTVLSVGNYLAALDDRAREILKHQVVLLVPCPNCYSYAKQDPAYQFVNEFGVDEYAGSFNDDMEVNAEKTPAAAALAKLVDERVPEFIFDAHGVWYDEARGLEICGCISFSSMNRTFDRSFVDAINRAAKEEGFAVYEEDAAQTLFPTDPICYKGEYRKRFRGGVARMLLGNQAYIKYHTLHLNSEVAFERSGLIRILKALELGNKGYPVQVMVAPLLCNSVRVAGKNAAERRQSRVELWPQNNRIGASVLYPETKGSAGLLITRNADAHTRVCGNAYKCDIDEFFENMEKIGYDMTEVREASKDEKHDCMVLCDKGTKESAVITHGLTMRLSLPYADAEISGVWLNGARVKEADYSVTREDNWTHVDVSLPSGDLPEELFAFVRYNATEKETGIVEF